MGEVVAFKAPSARAAPAPAATIEELAVIAAVEGGGDRAAVMDAAAPLLERLNLHYGFAVMRRGLPEEPGSLANALLLLSRSLAALDPIASALQRPRTGAFGVYFGEERLAWFEDGYGGETGLAVPPGIGVRELAAFVAMRLARGRRGA